MVSRRTFLTQAAAVYGTLSLFPACATGTKKSRVGLQLYTLRDIVGKDILGTIQEVANIGYTEIEWYGYDVEEHAILGVPAAKFYQILKTNGMTSLSGHIGADIIDGDDAIQKTFIPLLKFCHEVKQKYLIVPSLPEHMTESVDACKKTAELFNKAGERAKEYGVVFGYHNHAHEFTHVYDNGQSMYDILLAETDKEKVAFELDIYWVVRGGKDPIKILKENPGRFPLWHAKDYHQSKDETTSVGDGRIDFKELMKHSQTSGLEVLVVETEQYEFPPLEGIKRSYEYISKNLLEIK